MFPRSVALLFAVVALSLLLSQSSWSGDDKPHHGTVVKVADGKLTMTFKGDKKQHTHEVAKDAKITVDEKNAKLDDLKEGFHVHVWMNSTHALTKIEAKSSTKK